MKVRLTQEARADLTHIGDSIAASNPRRARSFVGELLSACTALSDMPLSCPLAPRYEAKGVRRRVHGRYLIFYRVEAAQVVVVRVLHGARDCLPLLAAKPGKLPE